jgi:hypothetical protein
MHEYLISFTQVNYMKNLRLKFTPSNYARIVGVIVLENYVKKTRIILRNYVVEFRRKIMGILYQCGPTNEGTRVQAGRITVAKTPYRPKEKSVYVEPDYTPPEDDEDWTHLPSVCSASEGLVFGTLYFLPFGDFQKSGNVQRCLSPLAASQRS